MVKSKWAGALVGVLAVGVLSISGARADDACKDHEARLVELEKRVLQLEEIIKQTPLPPNSYRTSTGAVFERVERDGFGKAIKAPDGTIWSEYQGDFTNDGTAKDGIVTDSAATRACAKIGGSLPTKQSFEKLKAYFELDGNGYLTGQGRKDLHKIFPDMKGRWFWSSSVHPNYSYVAYYFDGSDGYVGGDGRYFSNSVRCVGR